METPEVAHGKLTDLLLRERLAAPLAALAGDAGHPPADLILACAADELPPDEALEITAHLAACADGRCAALFRSAVAGQSAARDALFGARRSERSDTVLRPLELRSPRSFECDADLWALFERMAHEQGRPVDSLINEAMGSFREKNAARPSRPSPLPRRSFPPGGLRSLRLAVILRGVRYEITKPHFVVGRRAPASDLTIDDPAVSRQHAVVESAAGHFYLVDMGSTNGVAYQGERILRKEIADGDRFQIGDNELLFELQEITNPG